MGRNYKWAVVGMLWFVCFFNYDVTTLLVAMTLFGLCKEALRCEHLRLAV